MYFKKIGAQLKEVREKKGLSLDLIYEETKIQQNILKDIEEGTSTLAPIFLKGFIKSYAKFLEVELKSENFNKKEKSISFIENDLPQELSKQSNLSTKDLYSFFAFKRPLFLGLGLLVFLFTVVFLFKGFLSDEKEVVFEEVKSPQIESPSEILKVKKTPLKERASDQPFLKALKEEKYKEEVTLQTLGSNPLKIYFKVDKNSLQTKLLLPNKWYTIKALQKIYIRFDRKEEMKFFYKGKEVKINEFSFEKIFSSDTM